MRLLARITRLVVDDRRLAFGLAAVVVLAWVLVGLHRPTWALLMIWGGVAAALWLTVEAGLRRVSVDSPTPGAGPR